MTYDRYKELGGTTEEAAFDINVKLAEVELAKLTGGVEVDAETMEQCMMVLLRAFDRAADIPAESRASSVSNDGVSITFMAHETPQSIKRDAISTVRGILAYAGICTRGLGVLHRG